MREVLNEKTKKNNAVDASVQHLAVQGNPFVPDSVLCLPFFILLSCILVSEASLMSCMKKD